jgi:hypothetical protein
VLTGLVLGLLAWPALSSLIASLVYGVTVTDPLTFVLSRTCFDWSRAVGWIRFSAPRGESRSGGGAPVRMIAETKIVLIAYERCGRRVLKLEPF